MISCISVCLFTTMDSTLCFLIGRLVLCKYRRIGIRGLPCRGVYGGLNFPLLGEMSQNVLTPAHTLSVLVILLSFTYFIRF
jgi:hypothetical protein